MIWIDSSFAIEWLLGSPQAAKVQLPKEPLGILPMQYAETFTFFLRQNYNPVDIANELEALELRHPEKVHLQKGSFLYSEARKSPKSKVSLADAILAAVASEREEKILSFDHDFASLGLRQNGAFWLPYSPS